MIRSSAILLLPLCASASAASAQDISPVFNMGVLTGTMSMGATIKSECARAARQGQRVAPGTPWCDTAPASARAQSFTRPASRAARASSLRYTATLALRQQAVSDFLGRVRQHNADYARITGEQLARNDYRRVYDGIVGPYDLAGDDAANALAAYLLLGWMIVHDGQEPSRAAVQGVRGQAAAALSDPRLSAADVRARLGEEFKILFVVIHSGWQSARREGQLDRYAGAINTMFRNADGLDLQRLSVGPGGFQRG